MGFVPGTGARNRALWLIFSGTDEFRPRNRRRQAAPEGAAVLPARLLRRGGAGDRLGGAGAQALRRPRSTSATRSSTTATWSRACKAKGAIFVEELDEMPEDRRPGDLLGAWRAEIGAGEAASAQPVPRSTPPARWSPRCTARPRSITSAAARSCLIGHAGHPEVVGTMGQLPEGAVTLVETVADAETLHAARRHQSRLRDPDHAVGRRHGGHRRAVCKRRFPAIVGPHKEDICYATTNRQEAVKARGAAGRCA